MVQKTAIFIDDSPEGRQIICGEPSSRFRTCRFVRVLQKELPKILPNQKASDVIMFQMKGAGPKLVQNWGGPG